MVHQKSIIRIVSSLQVIGSDYLFLLQNSDYDINHANSPTTEKLLEQLNNVVMQSMFNNDEIFLAIFASMVRNPQDFTNPALYRQLVNQGMQCVQNNDINGLKDVISRLVQIMVHKEGSQLDSMLKTSGITK